jgi:hypothetical protein
MKLPTALLLACGVCAMSATSALAYTDTRGSDYEPNTTVYGYYTYSYYTGYDSIGTLTNELVRVDRLWGDTVSMPKPKGSFNGGTLGFSEKMNGDDTVGIETEYLCGRPDSTYHDTYANSGDAYDQKGQWKYDMKETSVRLYWTPAQVKFLTFAADYRHTDNTVSNSYGIYKNGVLDSSEKDFFGTNSDDVLVTMTAKTPDLYLSKEGQNAIYFNVRGEAGIGYTYRSCDKAFNYRYTGTDAKGNAVSDSGVKTFADYDTYLKNESGVDSNLAGQLPKDTAIYNYTGSFELAVRTQYGTISSISGYNFRGDLSESANSSNVFFTSIGYRYSW